MQRTPQYVTGNFVPHHCRLEDAEYGRALDALVKAVSDILVTTPDGDRVFLGQRKVEPQPDWWFIGGRSQPGETPQEAAARNTRRELGLDLPSTRFEVIGNYSFVWQKRAQQPVDHGTADISTVHRLTLAEDEEASIAVDEKEYASTSWFESDEVLAGEFHPALKQAIRDMRTKRAYEALAAAIADNAGDAAIARHARDLVWLGGRAPRAPVHVHFDQAASVYTVEVDRQRKGSNSSVTSPRLVSPRNV
mmetsp:Transcript_86422/g.268507  ORF Transcript_86422/g.268507 Transcript_86422/m.268507 type:complete len:249 (-) Transcript_86422:43-789(-)